ncbi:CHAT domain-containing protein [Baaleninema sp.]|uniref:CHAT domain-containing protein n=1 Tax=Baaleninema sp. TaxID=3101197 RepID=UPI003CFD73F0
MQPLKFIGVLSACALLVMGTAVKAQDSEPTVIERWNTVEGNWESQYEDYFRSELSDRSVSAEEMAAALDRLSTDTGQNSAVLYVIPQDTELELILVTGNAPPQRRILPEVDRETLLSTVRQFEAELINPRRRRSDDYLDFAQQLDGWIVEPLKSTLEAQQIETLVFCLGGGLRAMPLAALHDGEKFLVERYSIGRIPGFNLTKAQPTDLRNGRVLAMGASEFDDLPPLPAVPVELASIVPRLWPGATFLDREFTLDNLQQQRQTGDYEIVHLATHAAFVPGEPSRSYIQFWQDRLAIDRMAQLQWQTPAVELLVLSACQTALGDKDAEMGFAGIAIQSGIPSVIATLWPVSDRGTLAVMSEFYAKLKTAPTKTEALRQAQLAAIRGQLRVEPPEVSGRHPPGTLVFPELPEGDRLDLSHPYYWSGFTNIGNAW